MKLEQVIKRLQNIENRVGGDADVFVNDANGRWSNPSKYSYWIFNENTVYLPPSNLGKNSISEEDYLNEESKIEILDETNSPIF